MRGRRNILIGTMVMAMTLVAAGASYAQTCAPGSGPTITVSPTDNVQSKVTGAGCGATFMFNPGVYNNFSVVPLDYDQFISITPKAAILSGATTANNFVLNTTYNLWVGKITYKPVSAKGVCYSGVVGCTHPEDLFFNGKLYTRVNAITSVVTGTWYMDSAGDVYLFDNPTGQSILVSTTRFAFGAGNVTSVVINGFTIQYYASPANNGAVEGIDFYHLTSIPSFNWLVENNEIRYVHGSGVELGNRMTVMNNYVHHNGQVGVGGTGDNITVTGNEIASNNTVKYSFGWAGGVKLALVGGASVNKNYVHDNFAPGIWTDVESSEIDISFNNLTNNNGGAILHEIGYSATIHDNTITNDGFDSRGKGIWYGGAIIIANSSDVQVYNNTITNCVNGIMGQSKNRGNGSNGLPYLLQNVAVYSNKITQNAGFAAGIAKTYPLDNSVYTSSGNTFGVNAGVPAANTYTLSSTAKFVWVFNNLPNAQITYTQWQSVGNH